MISLPSVLKRLAVDKRFTALSVLTLARGIGLAVAIFALVHGVLLAPLRFDVPGVKKPVVEECRLELAGDRITIEFPSGNRMGFLRSER